MIRIILVSVILSLCLDLVLSLFLVVDFEAEKLKLGEYQGKDLKSVFLMLLIPCLVVGGLYLYSELRKDRG